MVTSTDRPTNRQGEYRAICHFRKLENRKKAEICNSLQKYVFGKFCLSTFIVYWQLELTCKCSKLYSAGSHWWRRQTEKYHSKHKQGKWKEIYVEILINLHRVSSQSSPIRVQAVRESVFLIEH